MGAGSESSGLDLMPFGSIFWVGFVLRYNSHLIKIPSYAGRGGARL